MFGVLDTPDGPVGYHLNLAKPRRSAPAGTIHKWSDPVTRGGPPVHCLKCGCKKAQRRDYTVLYVAPGGRQQTELRPPCTGKLAA
jgi:hypothetical protein